MRLLSLNPVHPLSSLAMEEPPAVYASRPEEDNQYPRRRQAQFPTNRLLAPHRDRS